jgi:AcrR family transcriptional regulator
LEGARQDVSPRPPIEHIRKPQLLAAAAEVIAERGFAATRITDVAERAGTSPAGVLYWFESRDELLGEALTFAEDRFAEKLGARLATLDCPSERLVALIECSVGGDDDWTLWIELWTRALRDPELAAARQRLDDRWRGQIAAVIAEGQTAGDFAGPDPERAALELSALMDGLAVQVALGDSVVTAPLMRATCVEVAERLLETELVVPEEVIT